MSLDHVSAVLRLGPEVAGTDRMVLLVLAEAAHAADDECWPSLDTIRHRAGLRQERYAVKAVRALEAAGLVHVTTGGCPDHRIPADKRPNLYRLTGPLAMASGGARRAPKAGSGGARRAPAGERDAQQALHTEPEVEPEVTPAADAADEPKADETAEAKAERKALARRIVQRLWERRDPKPVANFMGVVGITERCLEAGWRDQDVFKALMETRAHTLNAVEFQLTGNQQAVAARGSGPRYRLDPDEEARQRSAPSGVIDPSEL